MEKIQLMEKYPVYTTELFKNDVSFKNINEFVQALKEKIEQDPVATFIWVFDHYEHTKKLWWQIADGIKAAKIVLFCFWQEIPKPQALAARPRNIAIVEYDDKFVVSFLEAPKEKANEKMIKWITEENLELRTE